MLHARPWARARRSVRAVPAAALALALLTVVAPAAQAHDQLISTDPPDGAVLDTAPASVGLTFSEDVLDISTTVVVAGPDGSVPTTASVDGTTVTAPLPADLPDGAYTVTWRVVSSDGHPVQGSFGFTVQAAGPGTSSTGGSGTTGTASAAPPTSGAASPSTSASATPQGTAGTGPLGLVAGIAGAGLVAALLVLLLRRRRTRG
ncbi:MAG: copper resistance protein CopC [Actinomycetales bacterium]|nr:copper resistance protein CopC [Actinomycetales bacterium]